MARIRKVLFEAINEEGKQKRIGSIKAGKIHGITWKTSTDEKSAFLHGDILKIRSKGGSIFACYILEHGLEASIWFDEPLEIGSSFYINLECTRNEFIPMGTKRIYGILHVSDS